MPNWNSVTESYTPVRKPTTKALETEARELRRAGATIKEIATRLGRSESRIREYLRAP